MLSPLLDHCRHQQYGVHQSPDPHHQHSQQINNYVTPMKSYITTTTKKHDILRKQMIRQKTTIHTGRIFSTITQHSIQLLHNKTIHTTSYLLNILVKKQNKCHTFLQQNTTPILNPHNNETHTTGTYLHT